MSLTRAASFECPYCMTINDLEVDELNDIGQLQVVDCQICCQPIEINVLSDGMDLSIIAEREND